MLAQALLSFALLSGDSPPCLDAADVDGNGEVFGLVDTLYLLSWGFTNGPPPPAPRPDACGVDVENTISCETPLSGCLECRDWALPLRKP